MSRTKRHERKIRVVGQPRTEPDARRIAKAILALALDAEDASDRFDELAGDERVIARRRAATRDPSEHPDQQGRAS
jgi:hypothetical protein